MGEVEEEGGEGEAEGEEEREEDEEGRQPPALLDGNNPARQTIQLGQEVTELTGPESHLHLQSFHVGRAGRGVGLSAEQVEGEEGEVEHVGGGEAVVRHAGQITEERNSVILSEVETPRPHHHPLTRLLALAEFCQEDQK